MASNRSSREVDALVVPCTDEAEAVASAAAHDSGIEPGPLHDHLVQVINVARTRSRLSVADLAACQRHGASAARDGVALAVLLDLYLSASWRMWAEIESRAETSTATAVAVVAAAVLRAADDAAAALAEGYEREQRQTVRLAESQRREFVDDLLSGVAEPDHLHNRAARFGFALAGSHLVVVARTVRPLVDAGPVHGRVEAHVLASFGGRDVVAATKDGLLVCIFPGTASSAAEDLSDTLHDTHEGPWTLAVSGAHSGPGGLVLGYREAKRALELADSGAIAGPIVRFSELLAPRLLAADPALAAELVDTVLGPLDRARGGAQPLIDTINALNQAAGNVTAAARTLHLSPRAVTYRLDRIRELTGHSPTDADGRFLLELAVRARRFGITEAH
ncbi:MAG: hypothetical protein ACI8Y4_000990 [Candidatus Poriferisodalaceae bacterium]|jgi:hypothetical protein